MTWYNKSEKIFKNIKCMRRNMYAGYAAWLLPSNPSVPSLILFPHFCLTDRDRSIPDPGSLIQKELLQFPKAWRKGTKADKRELGGSISDQIGSDFIHLHYLYFYRLIISSRKQKSCEITNIIEENIFKYNIFRLLSWHFIFNSFWNKGSSW